MIKAIIFDCDGILIDAARWHEEAFNRALGEFNCDPLGHEEHLTTFNGLSTFRKLDMLASQGRIESDKDLHSEFYDTKQLHTIEIIKEKCAPETRVIDSVIYAQSRGHTAVVSNCSRITVEMMLRQSKLEGRFDLIITNNDVDGRIKPDPWPYAKACKLLGVLPQETLAIDDNLKGVKSATDAGCNVWHMKHFKDLTVMNIMTKIYGGFYGKKRMAGNVY